MSAHSFCHVVRLKMSLYESEQSVDLVHEVFQYLKDDDGRYPDDSTLNHAQEEY